MKLTKRINKTLKKRVQRKVKLTSRFQKGGEINESYELNKLLVHTDYPSEKNIKRKLLTYINNLNEQEIDNILELEYIDLNNNKIGNISDFFYSILMHKYENPDVKYVGDKEADLSTSSSIKVMSNNERAEERSIKEARTHMRRNRQAQAERMMKTTPLNRLIKEKIKEKLTKIFEQIKNKRVPEELLRQDYFSYLRHTLQNMKPSEYTLFIHKIKEALDEVYSNKLDVLKKIFDDLNSVNSNIMGIVSAFFSNDNPLNNNQRYGRMTRFVNNSNGSINNNKRAEVRANLLYIYLKSKLNQDENRSNILGESTS